MNNIDCRECFIETNTQKTTKLLAFNTKFWATVDIHIL